MSATKTYIIKVKNLETNRKDIAIVQSGNKQAAIQKFILHMNMLDTQNDFNIMNHEFEYDQIADCYFNKNKTLRLKIKHINLHNHDFYLL